MIYQNCTASFSRKTKFFFFLQNKSNLMEILILFNSTKWKNNRIIEEIFSKCTHAQQILAILTFQYFWLVLIIFFFSKNRLACTFPKKCGSTIDTTELSFFSECFCHLFKKLWIETVKIIRPKCRRIPLVHFKWIGETIENEQFGPA